ncbi:XrtA/PEP-CTERM system TPR-repeat protein PrsT [Thalassotalea piscium]
MNHIFKKSLISSVLLLTLGLSACGDNKSAEEYITQGKTYIDNNDFSKAIVELKNAVRLSPSDGNARLLLGQSYLEQGAYNSAEKELSKAVELGIDINSVVTQLVQVYSKLNDFDEVYRLIDESGSVSDENFVTILAYGGITAINESKLDKAKDFLKQAVNTGVESPYSLLSQGYLAYIDKEYDQGIKIADEIITNSPEVVDAYILKGYLHSEKAEYVEASAAFNTFISKHPQDGYVRLLEINSLIGAGELDEAQSKVDKILAANKQATLAKFYKAQISFLKEDYEKAIEFADSAINEGLDFKYTRLIAGVSAFKLNSYERAHQHLVKIVNEFASYPEIQRLYTFVQLKLGLISDASDTLNNLNSETVFDTSLFAAAGMQLARSGNIEQAKNMFSKANDLGEANAISLFQGGMLKLQTADISGVEDIKAAIKADDKLSSAWFTVALSHLQNNDVDKALSAAEEWQKVSASDGLALKGIIYIRLKDYDKAKDALQKAITADETNFGAKFNLARAQMLSGDSAAAVESTKALINENPNSLKSMDLLIGMFNQSKQLDQAQVFIDDVILKHPTLLAPKIARALVYQFLNQPQDVVDLLSAEKQRLTPEGWLLLGDNQLKLKDIRGAYASFQQWRMTYPLDLKAWLKELLILDISNQNQKALDLILLAEKNYGTHPQMTLLKLNYQTKLGLLTEADDTLNLIKAQKIDVDMLDRFEGQLALSKGDYQKAENLLSKYYTQYPDLESAELLAFALAKNGKLKSASDLLEQEFESKRGTLKGLFTVASFFSATNQIEKAITYYQKIIAKQPKSFIALNNLALKTFKLKDYTLAKEYALKALAVSPKDPNVLDTVGWIAYAKGETDEALEYLRQAYNLAPNNQEIKSHYLEVQNSVKGN